MRKLRLVIALLGASALAPALSHAQSADAFTKALHIYGSYRGVPNITYLTANNCEAKRDAYHARDSTTRHPALVYLHAGRYGTYHQRDDARERSLDSLCPGNEEPKVAAVINWYGITDVNELLAGANMRNFAVAWLGGMANREEIAKRVSPLTYVRAGLPPIISIQGDADPTVPYSQNVRLHQALDKAGISNELVTVPGGKHGGFSDAEMTKAYAAIRAFLAN